MFRVLGIYNFEAEVHFPALSHGKSIMGHSNHHIHAFFFKCPFQGKLCKAKLYINMQGVFYHLTIVFLRSYDPNSILETF